LATTVSRLRELVGKVAEDFAARLQPASTGGGRTPISGRRRAEARPTGRRHRAPANTPRVWACTWCGKSTSVGRKTCSNVCRQGVQALTQRQFVVSSRDAQRARWQEGDHPAHAPEARRKLSETQKERRAAEAAWDRGHPDPPEYERFRRDVATNLTGLSARAIARATGLSVSYCAAIKRGDRVPHPRWWNSLQQVSK
jgi:hypothetical protein